MPLDHLQRTFRRRLQEKGISLTDRQMGQFETYFHALISWNKKMNLTGITERCDVYWKHFYDSLTPAFFVDLTKCEFLLDVGSGAGFPAFPLKIAFPHLQITVIDSLKKRLTFLAKVYEQLSLKHVNIVHGRAEDLGQQPAYREKYDIVAARAVARLNVLSEYCLPFTRMKGKFIAMKTDQAAGVEMAEAKAAISLLGGGQMTTHAFELPDRLGNRCIISIVKEKPTPVKYPRRAGIPAKNPIRQSS